MNEQEQQENVQRLAQEIMVLARNTLLVHLRFLDASLHQLSMKTHTVETMATDGVHLYFNPIYVLTVYRREREEIVRNYLHTVFHCIFHHPFINTLIDQQVWDLACDIAVENALNELELKAIQSNRQKMQQKTLARLLERIGVLTAEKIYRYYLDQKLDSEMIVNLRQAFLADDHSGWYPTPKGQNDASGHQKAVANDALAQADISPHLSTEEKQSQLSTEEKQRIWKSISERVQVDIETISLDRWGDKSSDLHQNLKVITREKYDYQYFLERFCDLGEAMIVNDEEFDYVFYTYGLKLYKNIPLIEPLEYKEVRRIKEFVIAIDTSGSVEGDLVQLFVQKTYNILKQTESFFRKINLHIIQCDAVIQEDHKITSQEEFDAYLNEMTLKGFGGTDFRPVFSHVDQLITQGEFVNLKGLIYFTDGMGDYPAKKPVYETAFVFIDNDYNDYDVPSWAHKLILSHEDVQKEGNTHY